MMREIFLIFLLIFASCSGDETIDRLSLLALAKKADPTFTVVLADKIGGGPTCEGEAPSLSYSKGCVKVFRVKVYGLEFAVAEFETLAQAKSEAKRLNQYYFKNWLLDEVTTEASLEKFVKETFGAINPNQIKPSN